VDLPLVERWEKPTDTVAAQPAGGDCPMGRSRRQSDRLMEIAERLADTPQELDSDKTIHKALRGADASRT